MINLPDFLIIPYQLLEDKKITLIDERLYGIIYWLTKLKNERCFASNNTLADLVKTNRGTIQNSLTKLEELGYIKRTFKDESKRVRHEIIPLVVFSKVSPTNDMVSPTNDTYVSPTNEQNKKILNKKSLIRQLENAGFDTFWSLYPKKVERKKSEEKWCKLSFETQQKIISDLPKRIKGEKWSKDNGKYIEMPTTYLNGERWNDEIVGGVKVIEKYQQLKQQEITL